MKITYPAHVPPEVPNDPGGYYARKDAERYYWSDVVRALERELEMARSRLEQAAYVGD